MSLQKYVFAWFVVVLYIEIIQPKNFKFVYNSVKTGSNGKVKAAYTNIGVPG